VSYGASCQRVPNDRRHFETRRDRIGVILRQAVLYSAPSQGAGHNAAAALSRA